MPQSLVDDFSKLKAEGGTFDDFRKQIGDAKPSQWVQVIAQDQRMAPAESMPALESYLGVLPELAGDEELVLEAIYAEWLIREENGERIVLTQYIDRFPNLASSLQRQYQLHVALNQYEVADTSIDSAPVRPTYDAGKSKQEGVAAGAAVPKPEFDDLLIDGIAGSGGMGAVFRAHSTTLDRPVAVKVLSRSVDVDSSEAKRMEREARVVARLDHQNVIRIYDVRRDARGLPVILMEFVSGGTLANRLIEGPLPAMDAAKLMIQIADGVTTAHQSNLIHRDLKPANILLDEAGNPKVADFGLAQVLFAGPIDQTSMANFVGTPSYVSPEQARGDQDQIGQTSDVYSLGVILYEMLTGKPPFQAATAWEIVSDILNEDASPVRQLNRRVPVDLETICHRCLERSPQRRYSGAQQLRDDLQRFLDGKPIHAKRTSAPRRVVKWFRRNPVPSVAAGVIALALLSITAVSFVAQRRVTEALDETSAALMSADQQRQVAVDAMNDLVYTVHDQLRERQASVEARGDVLQSAMVGLQKIIDSDPTDVTSQLTMADAENRYAYILAQQSQTEQSVAEYEKAIRRADSIKTTEAEQLKALIEMNLGKQLLIQTKYQPGIERLEQSLSTLEPLIEVDPENEELLRLSCTAKKSLSLAHASLGDFETAIELINQIRPVAETLFRNAPDSFETRNLLADVDSMLGSTHSFRGELRQAAMAFDRIIELLEPLEPDSTEMVAVRTQYFNALMERATIRLAEGDYERATESLRKVANEYARLIAAEPQRFGFRLRMGSVQSRLAMASFATNDWDESLEHSRECISQLEHAIEMNASALVQRSIIAGEWARIGEIQLRRGQTEIAIESLHQVIENLQPIAEKFQMQAMLAYFVDVAALMDQVSEDPSDQEASDQDPSDVKRLRRGLIVLQQAYEDDYSRFIDDQSQLSADINEATNETIKALLARWFAIVHGRYCGDLLSDSDSKAIDDISQDEAIQACLDAVSQYLTLSKMGDTIQYDDPAFAEVRKTDAFQKAFPPRVPQ